MPRRRIKQGREAGALGWSYVDWLEKATQMARSWG